MDSKSTLNAACLCGATHFSHSIDSSSLPLDAEICHCDSCRHATGSLAVGSFVWPGPIPDTTSMTEYAFSPNVNVYFCSTCGTTMMFHRHDGSYLGVTTGILDNPDTQVRFIAHIFLPDTKDGGCSNWLRSIGGEEQGRYVGHMANDEKVPLDWPAPHAVGKAEEKEEGKEGEEGEVQVHCLCKGVEFKVTRPNEGSKKTLRQWSASDGTENKFREWSNLELEEPKYPTALCVCDSCRLASGVDITAWSYIPPSNIRLANGEALRYDLGTLKHYRSSSSATRYFCGTCGATVFWVGDRSPEVIDVAVGLLSSKSGALAEEWLQWNTYRWGNLQEANNSDLLEALKQGLDKYEGHVEERRS